MSVIMIANCLVFLFLSIIWSAENWFNLFIKLILIGSTVSNGVIALKLLGMVVFI